jgi:hypothetical protein
MPDSGGLGYIRSPAPNRWLSERLVVLPEFFGASRRIAQHVPEIGEPLNLEDGLVQLVSLHELIPEFDMRLGRVLGDVPELVGEPGTLVLSL